MRSHIKDNSSHIHSETAQNEMRRYYRPLIGSHVWPVEWRHFW